jgi:hypothetical protein
VSTPTSVAAVVARMQEIDAELPPGDGAAVFNRMYLTVTERVGEVIAGPASDPSTFLDPERMEQLDVRFANLWLAAYDADRVDRPVAAAWRPIFEAREGGRVPVQYALAGMNSHIEHDLPIAVFDACRARDLEPEDVHADYEAVNAVLAAVEAPIRRSFLDEVGLALDEHLGPVVHLISAWNIDTARDLSWITVETLWALRATTFLRGRFLDGVSHTVGMTSRTLLTPVVFSVA